VSTTVALARKGIAPSASIEQEAFDSILNDIVHTHDMHHQIGITGNKFMWQLLTDMGRSDIAVTLLQQRDYPSFGFMIEGGKDGYEPATTMWELWTAPLSGPGMNSRAHHMFSSVEMTFYNYIAGIQQSPGSVGFAVTQFRPRITRDARIGGATSTIPTMRGPASITWSNGTTQAAMAASGVPVHSKVPQVASGQYIVKVDLPKGGGTNGEVSILCSSVSSCSAAAISCNGHTVWSAGKFVAGAAGVNSATVVGDEVVFQVGPGGSFSFQSQA